MTTPGSTISATPRVIGEFVLIVAGVLVALYAQELVDRRGQRTLAEEYRARLAADLESDIRGMETTVRFLASVEEAGRRTLAWLRSDSPGDAQTLFMAVLASERLPFTPSTATYRDLLATGNLGLIDEADLRARLSDYNRADLAFRAEAWDLPQDYRRTVRGIVPLDLQASMLSECGVPEATISSVLATPCAYAGDHLAEVRMALRRLSEVPNVEEQLRYLLSQMVVGTRLFGYQSKSAEELISRLREAR